jgi:hypothetical protein
MLIDALMSAGTAYKLELYVEAGGVGGVIWRLNDDRETGQFLLADSDLAKLLSKFMQYVQQQPEPVVQGEVSEPLEVLHSADATGVPE